MKKHFALALPVGLLVLSGCGNVASNGLPRGLIHTNLVNNNVYSNWPKALVIGNAVQYGCFFDTDHSCITSGQQQADGSGNLSFSSDAIPGLWNLGAQADSYCGAGAGTSTQQLDPSHTTQLYCGSAYQATAYITQRSASTILIWMEPFMTIALLPLRQPFRKVFRSRLIMQ